MATIGTSSFTITKVKDGKNGTNGQDGADGIGYTCYLTNTNHTFVSENNGRINMPLTTSTEVKGYINSILTTPVIGTLPTVNGLTLTKSGTIITIQANAGTSLATQGSFDIPITLGDKSFTLTFNYSKALKGNIGATGASAVSYDINSSVDIMQISTNTNKYIPSTVTFNATKTVGIGNPSTYSGRFKIYESTDGSSFTIKYTSSTNESSIVYTPSSTSISHIKCELYLAGNTTTKLDSTTLPVIYNSKELKEELTTNYYNKTESDEHVETIIGNSTITKSDGTVVNMKDALNNVIETATEHTQKISNISTNINKNNNDITSLTNQYSELSQDVSGFKTAVSETYVTNDKYAESITNVTEMIQDPSGFAWYVNQNNNITNAQDIAKSANETAANAENKIDNLEVGGTNLVRWTKDFKSKTNTDDGWTIDSIFTKSVDDDGFTIMSASRTGATSDTWSRLVTTPISAKDAKNGLSVSFEMIIDDVSAWDQKCVLATQVFNSSNIRIGWGEPAISNGFIFSEPLESGKWVRVTRFLSSYWTMITNNTDTSITDKTPAYMNFSLCLVKNGSIHFRKFKVEKGNCSTDWSPHPLDISEGIEIGGTNLLHDTRTMQTYSTYSNQSSIDIHFDEDNFGVATFPSTSTLAWNSISTKPIQFKNLRNKKITFSLWVRSDTFSQINTESNRGLVIKFALCTEDSVTRTKYQDNNLYATNLSSKWQKISITKTLTDDYFTSGSGTITDTDRLYIEVCNYSLYSMEVKKFKLEFGDRATDWTPSVNDEIGSSTNLLKGSSIYTENSKYTRTATKDDDYKIFSGDNSICAYLEAGKEYIFNCETDGIWGTALTSTMKINESQSNQDIEVGSTNLIRANFKGGVPPLQYKVTVNNRTANTWTNLTQFCEPTHNRQLVYKSKASNTAIIDVYVVCRDSIGTEAKSCLRLFQGVANDDTTPETSYTGTIATDSVEAFLCKDGSTKTVIKMKAKTFIFTPVESGTYYLRVDINKSKATHSFWNFSINEGRKFSGYTSNPDDVLEAAKTATNYMSFDNDGLVIGNLNSNVLGRNILIDADSVDIRNGDTVLASYQENKVELGKNNANATIDFNNGLGQVVNNGGLLQIKGTNGFECGQYVQYSEDDILPYFAGIRIKDGNVIVPGNYGGKGLVVGGDEDIGDYANRLKFYVNPYTSAQGNSYIETEGTLHIVCTNTSEHILLENDTSVLGNLYLEDETTGQLFQVDFPIAQGVSGSWYYTKWNSGKCELWGITSASYANEWVLSSTLTYPFKILTRNGMYATLNNTGGNASTSLNRNAKVTHLSNTQCGVTVHNSSGNFTTNTILPVSVYIVGTWK